MRDKREHRGFRLAGHLHTLALLLCLWPFSAAQAQVPDLSYTGTPAFPLIGEQFCASVEFSNTGGQPGYGPYFVATVPPQITITSATFLSLTPPIENLGAIPASGVITDPISGAQVNGEPGGTAYLVRLPVGSVLPGQPPLPVEICGVVQVGAEIDVPLNFTFLPGFEFGDTPTGDDGPIAGSDVDTQTVTPRLARVEKSSTVIEGERPPGPSHEFDYVFSVDISDGVSISRFDLEDQLPDEIQWTGAPPTVAPIQGVLCRTPFLPNQPPVPGGQLVVTCVSLTGTNQEGDLVITLPVYITDVLDETAAAPDRLPIANTADITYEFNGQTQTDTDTDTVTAVHVEAYKSASPDTVVPGDTITFTVGFSATDYDPSESIDSLVLTDVMADGLEFTDNSVLTVDNVNYPITPTVQNDAPGAGQTTVTWDIAAAAGSLSVSGRGELSYTALVEQDFSNNEPVLSNDPLGNDISMAYEHSEGASDTNDSSAGADIEPTQNMKTIVSPSPVPSQFQPGDQITFRLEMDIPSGDANNVVLTDFLPLPILFVDDIDTNQDVSIPPPPFLQQNPAITTDTGTNSIAFDFGDISLPSAGMVGVDLTVTITDQAFSDGLFLTNLMSGSSTDTSGTTTTDFTAVDLNVGAPELEITKGVFAINNGGAVITPTPPADPATELVDSDAVGADAGDTVQYVITIENVGSKPAYNIEINDPVVPGLSCQDLQLGDVRDGSGATVNFNGQNLQAGITVPGPVQGNDTVPPGGGVPFSSDTLLITQNCVLETTVVSGNTLVNEVTATYTSTASSTATFPPISDDASVTIATPVIDKTVTGIDPGYQGVLNEAQIGEIISYSVTIQVPEGTSPGASFTDVLDQGLAIVSLNAITASAGVSTSNPNGFDPGVISGAVITNQGGGDQNLDRRLEIASSFGTVTNSNTDNGVPDTITLEYTAVMLNWTGNTRGVNRNNQATWGWQNDLGDQQTQDSAPNVAVVEPGIEVLKSFDPTTGDVGAPPDVSIQVRHNNASNGDAFELELEDVFPAGISADTNVALDLSNCATSPDVSQLTATDLTLSWAQFPQGSDCTVTFSTVLDPNVVSGDQLENCADIEWTSIFDPDEAGLPTPPANPLGLERTGDTSDTGTSANTYNDQNCATFSIFDAEIDKSVLSSNQVHTSAVNGVEQLAIGEEVTFRLRATLPEAQTTFLAVVDDLPHTELVLELTDWMMEPYTGTQLAGPGNLPPTPTISTTDQFLGDGIDDTVVFDFPGGIFNTADGVVDENDRLYFQVTGRVRDVPQNVNLDTDDNVARIQFGQGLDGTGQAPVQAVEPLLNLVKTGDVTNVEAGDIVRYRLEISHRSDSQTDAFDLLLDETLPPELIMVAGSAATAQDCQLAPDAGPTENGQSVQASWAAFPLGSECAIEFSAEVDVTAVSGSAIQNTADIEWKSLDDTAGTTDERTYEDAGSWTVQVSDPGLMKELVSSSIDETAGNEITIGEEVTFLVSVYFPDGTTSDVSVFDQLPFIAGRVEVVSSRISFIGTDLSATVPLNLGTPGDDCLPDCSTGNFGYDDRMRWDFGDVVNQPVPADDFGSGNGTIEFEVVGIVRDEPSNIGQPLGPDFLTNVAALTAENEIRGDLATFTLVEPRLELTHTDSSGATSVAVGAGDPVDVHLEIAHLSTSSAPAFTVNVDYQLDPSVVWQGAAQVTSNCPGLVTDDSALPQVTFSFDQLPLAAGSCDIDFPVAMAGNLGIPGTYLDRSVLTWESAPGSVQSRVGSDNGQLEYVAGVSNRLEKQAVITSVAETGSAENDAALLDLTIGEWVTYSLIVTLDEGTQNSVVLTDALPDAAGVGRALLSSASVQRLGGNVSTSLPGTPSISGNVLTMDFGTVTNVADGASDADDQIEVVVNAQILNDAEGPPDYTNADGVTISNDAALSADGSVVNAQAAVDIVEPALVLDKQFGTVVDNRVDIQLVVTNDGTAPAFNAVITDVFSETTGGGNWLANSMVPVQVPPGWVLAQASANDETTVTLTPSGLPANPSPGQIILPGQSIGVTFTMELAVPAVDSSILNEASVVADSIAGPAQQQREYTATGQDTLAVPILDSLKDWAPGTPVAPGDAVNYTITISNTGDGDATNVTVLDVPDTLGEFQAGTVTTTDPSAVIQTGNLPGDTEVLVNFPVVSGQASVSISYEVLVPSPYPAATVQEFVNRATITSSELPEFMSDDPNTQPIDDETVVPIVADPVMDIEKDDVADVVNAGGTVFYTIDYANTGDQDATGVVITETVPFTNVPTPEIFFDGAGSSPDWSCNDGDPSGTTCIVNIGALGGGDGGQLTFAVRVDDPLDQGVISMDNTVDITDDGTNTDPVNCNPDCERTDTASDDTPILAAPVLTIDKDDNLLAATTSQLVTYVLDYANIGNQNATNVEITETVGEFVTFDAGASTPGWTCPDGSGFNTVCTLVIGELDAGDSGQALFVVRVPTTLPAGAEQSINNTSITDDGTNSDNGAPVVDFGSHTTPLLATPDMVIDKDDGGIIGQPGMVFPYTLTYTNAGDQDATGVFLTETVPVGTTYAAVASLPQVWDNCPDGALAGTVCTLPIGPMAVGDTGTARFGVQVDDPVPAGQAEVTNTARVDDDGSNGNDPTPPNNEDTVDTLVTLFPPAGRKRARDLGSGRIQWTMTWFNNANTRDLPVLVLDPIPDRTAFEQGSLTCTVDGQSVCQSVQYDAAGDRIEVEAVIAEDFGLPDFTPALILQNEIQIRFVTTSVSSNSNVVNRGEACWDENNSGSPIDDRQMGQRCIPVEARIGVAFPIPGLDRKGQLLLVLLLFGLAGWAWRRKRGRIQFPTS